MNLKKILNKKNKGFSLVEILVVVLILSIMISSLIPSVSAATMKAKETQVKTDFRTFSTATESVVREYSGFAGVPMVAEDGRMIATIGETFWANGLDVDDTVDTPVTVSLIQAVNRYLESNYQFDDKVEESDGSINRDFGRSNAVDPWKQPYEIYFVARSKDAGLNQDLSSDKIYITSSGKTNNSNFADYTMLTQYKNGEVRTATVGFSGELYNDEWDYVVGKSNGKNYVALNDLFEYDATSSNYDSYFNIEDTAPKSLFNLGMGGMNSNRLYHSITVETDSDTVVEGISNAISAKAPVNTNSGSVVEEPSTIIPETPPIDTPIDTPIEKVNQTPPTNITTYEITHCSITVNAIEGCEYSIDGENWQDSTFFDNLKGSTRYTIYARYKATKDSYESESVSITVKTKIEKPTLATDPT